jgi:hypothetical protein
LFELLETKAGQIAKSDESDVADEEDRRRKT